ncbi:MAG: septum formation initiator family protein [Cellvibrio sp.]|jgi:cell division protein FtsB|nr:septum formation initiator family protein [Cellvibrio sp.]
MKWLLGILVVLLCALQYRLWIGEGSLAQANRLDQELKVQQAENDRLLERNRLIHVEVEDLKTGLDTIEERARKDIGLIKKDETFYMLLDEQ